jgi:hypothetical protein
MKTNSKLKREMDANFNAPLKLQNGLLPQWQFFSFNSHCLGSSSSDS